MELKPAIILLVLFVPLFWFLPLIVALFRAHARRRLIFSLNLTLALFQLLIGFSTSDGAPVSGHAWVLYGFLFAGWLSLLIWAAIGEAVENIRAGATIVSLSVLLLFGILASLYF